PLDMMATLPFTPTPIPGGSGVSGLVTGEAYIRFGPDVESPRIGVGKAGDRFEVIARYGQLPWLLILYSDAPNGVGWVFGDLLEIEGDVSSLPIWTPTQSQLASTIRDLRDILNPMREWKSVIIARQNIQRGELITADMLGEVDMPANLAPENTVSQMSRLVGQYAAESIQPWQPIRREQVAAEFNANTLPAGTVAVSVPTGAISDLSGIEAGNTVDVVAVLLFTWNDPAGPGSIPVIVLPGDPASLTAESFTQSTLETTTLPGKLRMERIVQGALVVRLNANTVTLAVPVEQATTLTGLVDAEVPMFIVPSGVVNLPAN
ncbi:MAG: SH3 domain-containing protein, partial [Anaerolineae bacterium]|nr:SH3 domain-containing protein [Anaerolineae bacterium]